MSTVNIKKRVIDELASSPVPLTRADIYQAIKQQVNVETKQVNNAVDNLTRQGFIDKGPSEYKNGAAVLTYKLTDKGVEYAQPVFKNEKTKITVDIQDAICIAPDDQPAENNAQEIELICMEIPTVAETEVESMAHEIQKSVEDEMEQVVDGLENVHLSDSAIETLVRDGYMVLDPMSESDQFICDLVNRLKTPPGHQIGDKTLKIATLENLAPLLSTDIHDVLMNIVNDLKQLEAAA